MAYNRIKLAQVPAEVTCVVGSVEGGIGYQYLGCNNGKIYKYNGTTGALTELNPGSTSGNILDGKIISMSLYSGSLYCGLSDGRLVQVLTS